MKKQRGTLVFEHLASRYMAKKNNQKALDIIQKALRQTAVQDVESTARLLHKMGLVFSRLGQSDLAARAWVQARKLQKRGFCAKCSSRWINPYGMRRRETPLQDDWQAFFSIQLANYIHARAMHASPEGPELQAIQDILRETFLAVAKTSVYARLRPEEKLRLFKAARPDLPHQRSSQNSSAVITGTFGTRSRIAVQLSSSDSCSCASLVAYAACCGRTVSAAEIGFGFL